MMFLKILQYNISSLIAHSRRIELLKILQEKNCTFAFIQETHLSSRHKVLLDNYNIIRNDKNQGVALFLKNNIKYELVDFASNDFPSVFISIKYISDNNPKNFLLGSVYIPSSSPVSALTSELNRIDQLANGFDGVIIGGDLNARSPNWKDHSYNINGKTFEAWLQNFNPSLTMVSSDTPTFPRGPSFLDHFLISNHLINNFDPNFSLATLHTFSDYCPLLLEIRLREANISLLEQHSSRSYKNTNWQSFRNQLDQRLHNFFPPSANCITNEAIDAHILHFNDSLLTTLNENSETSTVSFKKYKNLPKDIENLYKIKHQWQRRLKHIFHNSYNRINSPYRELSSQISLLNNIIRDKVNIWLNNSLSNRLSKITPGPLAFKEAFRLVGNKKKFFCNKVNVNDQSFYSETSVISAFETHFKEIFQEKIPSFNPSSSQEAIGAAYSIAQNIPEHIFLFDSVNSALNPIANHIFTDTDAVKELVKQLKPKKSTGPDLISNFALKKISDLGAEFLMIIYNHCINNAHFPKIWKTARLLPIQKKQNDFEINNFRPISLLSNTGKILEKIILNTLCSPTENPIDPIPDFQFGFRRGHSTLHALLKFQNDAVLNLREKKCTVACSLDVEKAFDSVWRVGLLAKLSSLSIPTHTLNILHSFLTDRSFFIQIQGSKSNLCECNSGVPQGSILGPHLYNIFINDFPHQIAGNNLLSTGLLYADDTIVYSSHESPIVALRFLEKHLNKINLFYKTWGIKLNVPKSELICIRNASGKGPPGVVSESRNLTVRLDGCNIQVKNKLKYLGVNFNNLLKFNPHAKITIEKARKISNMFMPFFRHKDLNSKTKLLFYKTLVRPVMNYAFPIWFSISPTVAQSMEILERKILRLCAGKNFESPTKRFSNNYIYNITKTIPLLSYNLSLMKKAINNLELVENDLINQVVESQSGSSWDSTSYLSPLGILSLNLDSSLTSTPLFYAKATLGQNRG